MGKKKPKNKPQTEGASGSQGDQAQGRNETQQAGQSIPQVPGPPAQQPQAGPAQPRPPPPNQAAPQPPSAALQQMSISGPGARPARPLGPRPQQPHPFGHPGWQQPPRNVGPPPAQGQFPQMPQPMQQPQRQPGPPQQAQQQKKQPGPPQQAQQQQKQPGPPQQQKQPGPPQQPQQQQKQSGPPQAQVQQAGPPSQPAKQHGPPQAQKQQPQQPKGQPGPSKAQQQQPPREAGPPGPQQRKPGDQHGRPVAQGGALRPPLRNGQGTLGRKIAISANHFAVKIRNPAVFHYDVDVSPLPPKALYKKVVLQWMNTAGPVRQSCAVFDMKKSIYTARRIQGLDGKKTIDYKFVETDRGDPRELMYKITIQPTGEVEIDLSAFDAYFQSGTSTNIPLRPLQALDIALKYGAQQRPNKVMLGSCLLEKPAGKAVYLGDGVEVWFGHFQSLRLGWQPFLNVDATQRAFLMSGQVHEIMAEMYRTRPGDPLQKWDYEDFGKKIATLKVSYPRKGYTANVGCNGIKGPANVEKFEHEGKTVTVQQYFEQMLQKKLQFPHLPCVWVGSREKRNLVPMEICSIAPGQEYRRKLSDIQTSNMIKVAATPADERKRKILQAVQNMNFGQDEYARNFGVSVDTRMVQLGGRVLPAPKLAYGANESSTLIPRDGVWNMQRQKFIDGRKLLDFGVINITRCDDRAINTFIDALSRAGRDMGMEFGKPLFFRNCHVRDLERDMHGAKKNFPKLQILFVIINRKGDPAYEVVKRVGDLDLRLTTQCIQQKNVMGRNGPDPSTMANICLKLNAKLGGINNMIARDVRPAVLLNEQVMIMGADVTHPGADQQDSGKPSIAAVVASVDPRASQYVCEIRIQKSKQEYIEDMENMVLNLLKKFNRATGSTSTGKPQRIIFYRDGVSDGQFAKVLEWELSAIRKACARLENGYEPPVTFVVVQKRHHTRLFPDDPRDECGRGKNVPPGTVVDTTIVHPTENDFYLVSHLGIQGTSRPTHYHLLWDDGKFTSDELQKLTYYLCYLFVRCTRSVSYPAPCYYSHLVAFRGRQYYDGLMREGSRLSSVELQNHIDSIRATSFMFFV